MSISAMTSIHNCHKMEATVYDGTEYDFCTLQLDIESDSSYKGGRASVTLFFKYKMKEKMERIREAINDIMNDVRCEDKTEELDNVQKEEISQI